MKILDQLKTLMTNHKNRIDDGMDELESLRGLHNAVEFLLEQKKEITNASPTGA